MKNQTLLNEINRKVGEIIGETKGINKRLDIMNGTNFVRDKRINKIEHDTNIQTGKNTVISAVTAIIISIIGLIIAFFKIK